jgi:hypothetical protein
MRKVMILFLCVLSPWVAIAQMDIGASAGYAYFAMGNMKIFQKQLSSDFPVNPEITSSFPPFWNFEFSLTNVSRGLVTGGAINYTSTGGRIYYSDYSGMVSVDKLLSHVGISGIIGGKININHEKYLLLAQLRPSLMMTTFTIKSDQSVGSQSDNESYKFTSLGLSFQPTFSATRKFGHFGLQAFAGYNLNVLQGKLYLEDGDDAYITMDDEKPLKADWSGFRVSFGLSYQVNR